MFSFFRRKADDPKAGETWVLRNTDPEDPFPPRDHSFKVTILEVKQGWVRYYMGDLFPDNRMEKSQFMYTYQRHEDTES